MSVAQQLPSSPEPVVAPRRRAVLTVVPVRAVAAQTRGPFAASVVALLITGLFGLLFLNTVLGKDSFRLHDLRVQAGELADTEQRLVREVEALRAPGTLATKATEMGMVQAGPPAFLRLSDGAVLGATDPAAPPVLDPAVQDPAAQDPAAQDPAPQEPVAQQDQAAQDDATPAEEPAADSDSADSDSADSDSADSDSADSDSADSDSADSDSADSE